MSRQDTIEYIQANITLLENESYDQFFQRAVDVLQNTTAVCDVYHTLSTVEHEPLRKYFREQFNRVVEYNNRKAKRGMQEYANGYGGTPHLTPSQFIKLISATCCFDSVADYLGYVACSDGVAVQLIFNYPIVGGSVYTSLRLDDHMDYFVSDKYCKECDSEEEAYQTIARWALNYQQIVDDVVEEMYMQQHTQLSDAYIYRGTDL